MVESEIGAQRMNYGEVVSSTTSKTDNEEVAVTQKKCVLEGVNYLNKFCTASRKIEGTISGWNYDPFSILLMAFAVYFIYVLVFRRR